MIADGSDLTTVVAARRRRRRVQVALSALAVLAVTGAAVGATRLARGPVGGAGRAPAAAPPAELTIDGKTVHRTRAAPIGSVQATGPSASTLLLQAGYAHPRTPNPCHPWTDVRVAGEDDRTVTLTASTYVDRSGGPSVTCPAVGLPVGRFSVRLAAPLAGRRVVQEGRVLRVLFTDALLHATVLPDGYAKERHVEEEPTQPGLTRTMHAGPDPGTALEIDEGPVDQPLTDPDRVEMVQVLDRLTVRGHPAVFRQAPGFDDNRCLVWAETATTGVAVCSLGMPARLTAAQLATVAEGLVRTP